MMRRLAMGVAIMLVCMVSTSPAFAKHHHKKHHYKNTHIVHSLSYADEQIVSHPAGCPRTAFCGCGVSVKVFGHPVRDLYLAANWFKFPRASPAPGMVAVRNHHVMYIEQYDGNGNAVVYDPNSGGHQTRIHMRSLDGYRIVNPNHNRFASW